MMKACMGTLLIAVLAGSAGAAVPEGKGSVALGLSVDQAATLAAASGGADYYYGHTGYGLALKGDAPIWSGIALGLNVAGSTRPYEMDVNGFAPKTSESIALYGLGADLRLYPAAFMGKAFKPGDGANPDGWLLWPSVNLAYSYSKRNDFNRGWTFAPVDMDVNIYAADQDFSYELVLPVATSFSARAGYLRNSVEDITFNTPMASPTNSIQNGAAYESEWLGLSTFMELVPGAGADATRAFVPHLGRVGTLRADVLYQRRVNMINALFSNRQETQALSLALSAPVTASLGLGLSVARVESDQPGGASAFFMNGSISDRVTWNYGLSLSWAFGDPAKRVD